MANQYGPRIVTDGLVLCLDAGNSKSYPGSGTTWADLSGNSNNATLTNGPSYNSANKGSIVFDGSNDYAQLSNSTSISASRNTGLTIGYWLYSTNNSSIMAACGISDNNATGFNSINMRINASASNSLQAGSVRIAISDTSSPVKILSGATNANNIPINQWSYIMVSSNPTNNIINLYINGINYTTTYNSQQSPNSFSNFTQSFYIGGLNGGGSLSQPFAGRISHFTFYNKILSQNEIIQNYKATKGRFGL